MSESRLVALARQAQNLQPERRTNTLSELRGRWSDYVNPYQTPPQQLSDLANPLRWPAMAVEGIQTAVETVPRMLQPGYDYSDTRQAAEDAFNVAGVVGAGSLLGTAAKPANAVGTFGGKLGSAASDLDMSQAARMARAKDMGFDTDQVWYHGTGNNFESFDLSADPIHNKIGEGIWLTRDLNSAQGFANRAAQKSGNSPVVQQLHVRGDLHEVDVKKDLEDAAREAGVDMPSTYNDYLPLAGDYEEFLTGYMHEARKLGKKGVLLRNNIDDDRFSDQAFIFSPSDIRSVNAAFDPAKSDSANLLASRGAPVPVEQRRRRDKDEIF